MARKRNILRSFVTLAGIAVITGCASTQSLPTPALLPTATTTPTPIPTMIPTATATPSPTPVTVPGGTFSFEADYKDQITISEQSIPIEYEFSLDQLIPGEYVLYIKISGNDQDIWVVSLDRKVNKKWISCRNCPIYILLDHVHKLDSGWEIIGHTPGLSGYSSSVFILDTSSNQIRLIDCVPNSNQFDCDLKFSPHGNWLYFYTLNFHKQNASGGPKQSDLYFISRTGKTYAAAGTLSAPPIAWAPDDNTYVSMPEEFACPDQYQAYQISLDEKQVILLSKSLCQLESNAQFNGWSPDGSYVALVWGNPRRIVQTNPDMITVCPASEFLSGDVSGCKAVAKELSKGWPLGSDGIVHWVNNDQFFWSMNLYGTGNLEERIGTIAIGGQHRIIYPLINSSIQSVSPDGMWVIVASETTALGVYNLDTQNPSTIYLTTPGNFQPAIWIQVP